MFELLQISKFFHFSKKILSFWHFLNFESFGFVEFSFEFWSFLNFGSYEFFEFSKFFEFFSMIGSWDAFASFGKFQLLAKLQGFFYQTRDVFTFLFLTTVSQQKMYEVSLKTVTTINLEVDVGQWLTVILLGLDYSGLFQLPCPLTLNHSKIGGC